MQHPQLQLPLKGQLFHFSDGTIGSADTRAVRIEIEHDALAVTAATQLRDLLTTECCPKRSHGIGHPSSVQGNHIEITLDHHSPVVFADR